MQLIVPVQRVALDLISIPLVTIDIIDFVFLPVHKRKRAADLCRQESADNKAGHRRQSKHNLECKSEQKTVQLSLNYPGS